MHGKPHRRQQEFVEQRMRRHRDQRHFGNLGDIGRGAQPLQIVGAMDQPQLLLADWPIDRQQQAALLLHLRQAFRHERPGMGGFAGIGRMQHVRARKRDGESVGMNDPHTGRHKSLKARLSGLAPLKKG